MRAQNYRPKIHSGTLAKRRTVSSASSATSRSRASRHNPESRGQGARVLWILMIIGGLIGSGFVMAQNSQINVHQFKQAEEKVKTQLDEMTNQQRFLALEKERLINTQESERIARQSGLTQPKLDGAVIQQPRIETPDKPQSAAKPSPKPPAKTAAKPAIKQVAKSPGKPTIKATALPKQSAKQSAVKPASRVAPSGKVIKSGKNQQLARKQDVKKEKRR